MDVDGAYLDSFYIQNLHHHMKQAQHNGLTSYQSIPAYQSDNHAAVVAVAGNGGLGLLPESLDGKVYARTTVRCPSISADKGRNGSESQSGISLRLPTLHIEGSSYLDT